jgi:hypothetical protein
LEWFAVSVDLCVFHTGRPLTNEDAAERYAALCREEDRDRWIEPSPHVRAFYEELTGLFPDDGGSNDPWAAGPLDHSDGHVIMNMPASKASEIRPIVLELAEKHGLVCFDPQSGRIAKAPQGLHVSESVRTPEDQKKEERLGISPFVKFIDSIMKSRGFSKERRVWRCERENTIAALELVTEEQQFEIWLCIWLKAKGKIDVQRVKPLEGEWHIQVHDLSDMLPDRLAYRLYRATDWGGDYCDLLSNPSYFDEETRQKVAPYFEPREPLTMEWRQSVLREVIEGHVLPWLDDVESNHRDYYGWGRASRWLRGKFGKR